VLVEKLVEELVQVLVVERVEELVQVLVELALPELVSASTSFNVTQEKKNLVLR